jgi:ubiquinone/menaquinone biosynthesis C-methylase UbiE
VSADALPFQDRCVDIVVSTRFLAGIVSYRTAVHSLREFRRVTRRYVIRLLDRLGFNVVSTDPFHRRGFTEQRYYLLEIKP